MDKDEKKLAEQNHEAVGGPENAQILPSPETAPEQQELTDDQVAHQKARQEIESMDLDDGLKTQAHQSAAAIQDFDQQKKLQHLLGLAKDKGVIFAVHAAKKLNDPFVLDALHDALVKNGHYKEFLK